MGVNSTALMILLNGKGIEFESVFCDTGVEYPETYEYLSYLQNKGYEITVIKPNISGCSTLEEYCLKYKIIPSQHNRWCTDKFKIRPLIKYFGKSCVEYIGIAYDEGHRTAIKKDDSIHTKFPLIENRITRDGCVKIIKDAKLEIPQKSGCWLCPFMSKKEVRHLFVKYPNLYERRKKIEEVCPRDFTFDIKGKPMSSIAPEKMPKLESFIYREK